MAEKAILEPLLPVIESNPEVAIPVIVVERGLETIRNIETLTSGSTPSTSGLRRRIPQPFLRGSPVPPPTYAHTINPRGGTLTTTTTTTSTNPLDNVTTTYEVPRDPEGKIDLDAVLRQRENTESSIRWLQDEAELLRDRKEVRRIRRDIIASDQDPYPPQEREPLLPLPEDQIEIPVGGDIDLFQGDFGDADWRNLSHISSDDKLSDEDVGLGGEPFPRAPRNRTNRIPWYRRLPPGPLQNPKFELPPQQQPPEPTPIPEDKPIDNPPNETIPVSDDIPMEEEPTTEPPTVTEDIHKENPLLIQPVPYEVTKYESLNAFPIFVGGIAIGVVALGVPYILRKKNKKY